MDEELLRAYFEELASKHKLIGHQAGVKDAFFYVENPYGLSEIDNALRNTLSFPALILDTPDGLVSDNTTKSYTDTINVSFAVVTRADDPISIRSARALCKSIGMSVVARVVTDARNKLLIADKHIPVRFESDYSPIGPMIDAVYGYQFALQIICPFGFSVDSGNWLDR